MCPRLAGRDQPCATIEIDMLPFGVEQFPLTCSPGCYHSEVESRSFMMVV